MLLGPALLGAPKHSGATRTLNRVREWICLWNGCSSLPAAARGRVCPGPSTRRPAPASPRLGPLTSDFPPSAAQPAGARTAARPIPEAPGHTPGWYDPACINTPAGSRHPENSHLLRTVLGLWKHTAPRVPLAWDEAEGTPARPVPPGRTAAGGQPGGEGAKQLLLDGSAQSLTARWCPASRTMLRPC